ncbi:MAG: hypothetical protein R2877_06435 [Bdellovibrionota bacterium]
MRWNKGDPVQIVSIADLLHRMEVWNEKKFQTHQDQIAEFGNLDMAVLSQFFSNLKPEQLRILETKYMKHGYFVLPPIQFSLKPLNS